MEIFSYIFSSWYWSGVYIMFFIATSYQLNGLYHTGQINLRDILYNCVLLPFSSWAGFLAGIIAMCVDDGSK